MPRGTRIPFEKFEDGVRRPFVYLYYQQTDGGRAATLALIDSGADGSSLPLWVAQELGVELEAEKRFARGASGEYAEFRASGNVRAQTSLGPLTLKRPSVNEYLDFVLLGRRDFFATFRVSFDERARAFFVERYVPAPRAGNRPARSSAAAARRRR